jgi:ribosomal peptide maturation radical SAM protein 1
MTLSESAGNLRNLLDLVIATVPECDMLLIVPPCSARQQPSLACHLLQALAQQAGAKVAVLYANLTLAASLGSDRYDTVTLHDSYAGLLGERLFRRAAFDLAPLGFSYTGLEECYRDTCKASPPIDWNELCELEEIATQWVSAASDALRHRRFRFVGCTNSFQQTCASIALLNRIKEHSPETVTLIGGSNCEGAMALGIASLTPAVDYVFAGESDSTFVSFLQDMLGGRTPVERIIEGTPLSDLDSLPTPSFAEYFAQLEICFPGKLSSESDDEIWIPYESSRGCWWGQKHHCTFCGLNGNGMRFREKSYERVIGELRQLIANHQVKRISTTDNIMPHSYFNTLLPRLANDLPGLHIHYEQKSNLTLAKVTALHKAGIREIQPGIEALATPLLQRMEKGVTASQNVALLRYCLSVGVAAKWNILYQFPGDTRSDFESTLQIVRLIHHLAPPSGVFPVVIDRFSPYFNYPERYGIRNLRPSPTYASVFPPGTPLDKIAYHFDGDYSCGSASRAGRQVMDSLIHEVELWQREWTQDWPPRLVVNRLTSSVFGLVDTRGLPGTEKMSLLSENQARTALVGARERDYLVEWALAKSLLFPMDGRFVPLATAEPELLAEMEEKTGSRKGALGGWRPTTRGPALRVVCE